MGTSGSYGGSKKKSWTKARQAVNSALGGGGGDGQPRPPDEGPPKLDLSDLKDILHDIADGLHSDDAALRPGSPLLAGLAAGALGASLAGLPAVGRRTPGAGGGGGGAARRSVAAGAARTGTALGAGFALRGGDSAALADIGLDLAQMANLSPREQTQQIVDRVFGASADENEQAGREASAVILLGFLESDDEQPDYSQIIRDGVAEFVFQRAMVEVCVQLTANVINHAEAEELQREMRDYIQVLINSSPTLTMNEGELPSPAAYGKVAAAVTASAINLIREGKTEA